MTTTQTTGSEMVKVTCRCEGSGKYIMGGRNYGVCYACNGSGFVKVSATAVESAKFYGEARKALRAGIEGARAFFRANRTNQVAVSALYYAMLEDDMTVEARKLYDFCAKEGV